MIWYRVLFVGGAADNKPFEEQHCRMRAAAHLLTLMCEGCLNNFNQHHLHLSKPQAQMPANALTMAAAAKGYFLCFGPRCHKEQHGSLLLAAPAERGANHFPRAEGWKLGAKKMKLGIETIKVYTDRRACYDSHTKTNEGSQREWMNGFRLQKNVQDKSFTIQMRTYNTGHGSLRLLYLY